MQTPTFWSRRTRVVGSLWLIAVVFLIAACGGAGDSETVASETTEPSTTMSLATTTTSMPPTTTSTTTGPPTPAEEGATFVAIHREVADLFWDMAETVGVVDDPGTLMVETGQRFVDLGDQARVRGEDDDSLLESYGNDVRTAGEALIRAGEAADRGDTGTMQEELAVFLSRTIAADTNSYYIVGELAPNAGTRAYGQDIGDVVYRQQFPVPGDGTEHCVAGDTPCMGWFSDQPGSVSDPELVTREVQRFVEEHRLPLAVVVIGDIGRRHPISYSTELIEAWQIHGQGPEDGILLLVALDHALTLVRQGAGQPIAADITEISLLGREHFAQGDTDGGIVAVIDGIESGLDTR